MAIDKVREYFRQYGIEDRIQEFPVSSATVDLAAQALGIDGSRIAKSMGFKVGEQPVMVVMAGDARISNPKFRAQFNTKAKMLNADEVLEFIGHVVGGVCPFAINKGVTVYLDESLKRFDIVYPACGSSNSAIGLTIEELENYSLFSGWVDIGKLPE